MKRNLFSRKPTIFIKIGGSLITDKTKPYTLNERALDIICREIKRAQGLGKQLVVGHGAGSFGHVPAKKYQTHKGVINNDSLQGLVEVADVAGQLNRIVVKKLIEKGVRAVSISPLSIMVSDNFVLKSLNTDSLEQLLRLDLMPVVYGDVILDTGAGCTIFSTEKVLGYLALHLKKKGYEIERIIHCGQTNGVYDSGGNTIGLITPKTFSTYQAAVTGSHGTDVTGGMEHKVEESLVLAKAGIPGLIIDGIEQGTLSQAVAGESVLGTRVEA